MQAYNILNSFNESIYFDYAPVPTFAGHINRHPFKINITSSNDSIHVVTLDSKYSKSYKPQTNKSKWSFLRPEVRFLDLNGNEIDKVITKDTKIYKNDSGILNTVSGTFMGVSGYAEFYFVDDIYNYDLAINKNKYSTIIAILQTSGVNFFDNNISEHILKTEFSNSKAIAYQPHIFHYRDPDYIKITENGVRDFINPRWSATNQHVIFTFNWNQNYVEQYYDGNEIKPINLSFNKSLPSNTNKNSIEIISKSNDIQIYYSKPVKVSFLDENRYLSPGYCKTLFNVGTASNNVILSAESTFLSPVLSGNLYSSKLWVSNPNAGLMSIIDYNSSNVFKLSSQFLQKANIYNFEVPIINKPNPRINDNLYEDVYSTTGYHNINSIAVLPGPSYQAWAIDGELNYLYKINTNGKILSAIDLLEIYKNNIGILPDPLINNQLSPNSIVLDKDLNLWITLYDNKYVLNLDSSGNFIYALDITGNVVDTIPPTTINNNWFENNQSYPYDSGNVGEYIEPAFLDVDTNNYIWVSYSNYTSGYLVKYDKNNNIHNTIVYPVCSCPQDIIINKHNDVWVSLSNNIWKTFGSIEKRDTNGNLLSSFKSIMGVNELTLDPNQNLWFTYSYSRIGCIDNITGKITTFNVLDNSDLSKYAQSNLTIPDENTDETALEGIACDIKGNLYVINSVENQIYVYDTKTKTFIDKFYVTPKGFTFWNPKGISIGLNGEYKDETLIEYNRWNKSLQAHGDWTGWKWVNKYRNDLTKQVSIKGQTNTLNFLKIPSKSLKNQFSFLASTFYKYIETNDLKKIKVSYTTSTESDTGSILDFYKINEDFDLAKQIKSYAFTPTLFNSEFLFNKFFPSIYGIYPFEHHDLGILAYEKISNFLINNSDIDTCEIKNIQSLAQSINVVDNDNYMLNYPEKLKRLMDVLSINQSRIFGSNKKNQNNFKKPDKDGSFNRGSILTLNYVVTAGTPVILRTKSLDKYDLIQTGPINENYQYNIIELIDYIKLPYNNSEWMKQYEFYEFVPTTSQIFSDNIIDWNNPQTTLTNNISSVFDWIGDEQYMDGLFSYNIYSGLGIF